MPVAGADAINYEVDVQAIVETYFSFIAPFVATAELTTPESGWAA